MGEYRVGIVIPALNESKTIAGVVESVRKFGAVIVVDDGSTDNTASLARFSGAIVISHGAIKGYDEALNSGFKISAELGCQIIITMDGDGQHDPVMIQNFIDAIDIGADVVVGVRNRRQRFAEHLFAWYANLRYEIKDPLCGMKAYQMHVYKSLGHFDSYASVGTELLLFAAMKGCCIRQLNFEVKERRGKSRFGQIFSANYKIIRALGYAVLKAK
jgi:glycosyltransferase involved in cell wall biosynthesis